MKRICYLTKNKEKKIEKKEKKKQERAVLMFLRWNK